MIWISWIIQKPAVSKPLQDRFGPLAALPNDESPKQIILSLENSADGCNQGSESASTDLEIRPVPVSTHSDTSRNVLIDKSIVGEN